MNPNRLAPPAGSQSIQERTPRRRFSPEEKSAIAAEWVACARTPNHPTMESWARERRLSARQVRSFVRRYQPGQRWGPEIRSAILKAIASLKGVLDALDSAPGLVASEAAPQHPLPLSPPQSSVAPQALPTTMTARGRFRFDEPEEGS